MRKINFDDWNWKMMIGKKIEKNDVTMTIMLFKLKKEKYILLMSQNITQIVKNKLFF